MAVALTIVLHSPVLAHTHHRGALITRSTRRVAKGAELFTNYIGRQVIGAGLHPCIPGFPDLFHFPDQGNTGVHDEPSLSWHIKQHTISKQVLSACLLCPCLRLCLHVPAWVAGV
jgi:hypothetical protein